MASLEYRDQETGATPSTSAIRLTDMAKQKSRFLLCVNAGSYKASLEPRKVYRVVDDPSAEAKSLMRVIDESGEDYLLPADLFAR